MSVPMYPCYVNCHSHCCTETTTKCMWAKLHVPNICSGQDDTVKFTQSVTVTEIVFLFQYLANCVFVHVMNCV